MMERLHNIDLTDVELNFSITEKKNTCIYRREKFNICSESTNQKSKLQRMNKSEMPNEWAIPTLYLSTKSEAHVTYAY